MNVLLHQLKKIKHKLRIRTRYRDFKKKVKGTVYVYRTNGLHGLSVHIKSGIKKRLRKNTPVSQVGDVLFISINDSLLDRYRTDHMVASLESTGMTVGKVFYYELTPDYVKKYNVFIFYRCPWLPSFENVFKEIKSKNKVSIYAVDDLVIDKKYTDTLPPVQALHPDDRVIYDDGVERHGKLMKSCDYAITTTNRLADELKSYKNLKDVYIDRNSMSDDMVYYSNKAIEEVEKDKSKIIIGYFSGTNTHNEDFRMVAPALVRILKKYKNTYIKLAGRVDAPEALKGYEDRLIYTPYVDWKQLPFELREADIILAPLVDSLFNQAKSEIKWSESALVGVPVVASNLGAFKDMVRNNDTGILVENTSEDWYKGIETLIHSPHLHTKISKNSRNEILNTARTTGVRAVELRNFLDNITPDVIAFGGVNIGAMSGGNTVIKKHMDILREAGYIVYGVESMDYHENDRWLELNRKDDETYDIFRINSRRRLDAIDLRMHFDRFIATFWGSVEMVDEYPYINKGGKKLYLVQGMEADFYPHDSALRRRAIATYRNHRIKPITISKWCQKWLKNDFHRISKYASNGIDLKNYPVKKRAIKERRINILIEGDSQSHHKRVDEAFEIANMLDRERFKVSYLSNNSVVKSWYQIDELHIKVPANKVGEIYAQNDILIKSSLLESFSYPPLEMMATGGVTVLVKNGGNSEYIKDSINALYYEAGNIEDALEKIHTLSANQQLYSKLASNGIETSKQFQWQNIKDSIIQLYK